MSYQLEVCVDTLPSALAAAAAGADRLELCSALSLGGLTPSAALIAQVCRQVSIPVHVLIRPRAGDFCYQPSELVLMLEDIRCAFDFGAAGVVVGAQRDDGGLDGDWLSEVAQVAAGRNVCLHRVVDVAAAVDNVLAHATDFGLTHVLSSGRAPSAQEGIEQLARWRKLLPASVQLMAGAGVNAANAQQIIRQTHVTALHASCKQLIAQTELAMGGADTGYFSFDPQAFAALQHALNMSN